MGIMDRLRPEFWNGAADGEPYRSLFNYRRVWRLSVLLLAAVTLFAVVQTIRIEGVWCSEVGAREKPRCLINGFKQELAIVRKLGCKKIQGYYFGRPMPAEEAATLFQPRVYSRVASA